jgi:hypothetical protein
VAVFVELPEKGWYLNLDNVNKFQPSRSNRIDYVGGGHDQLSEADASVLMAALERAGTVAQTAADAAPATRRRAKETKPKN